MICPNCRSRVNDAAKFCEKCGVVLPESPSAARVPIPPKTNPTVPRAQPAKPQPRPAPPPAKPMTPSQPVIAQPKSTTETPPPTHSAPPNSAPPTAQSRPTPSAMRPISRATNPPARPMARRVATPQPPEPPARESAESESASSGSIDVPSENIDEAMPGIHPRQPQMGSAAQARATPRRSSPFTTPPLRLNDDPTAQFTAANTDYLRQLFAYGSCLAIAAIFVFIFGAICALFYFVR